MQLKPSSDSVSLRLRDSYPLTSLHTATRRLILQKARHHPLWGSDRLWVHGFRFSFTPLPGSFSPFPHGTMRYRYAEYSALEGGPPSFRQDSSCPGVLRNGAKHRLEASRTGPSPSPAGLPRPFRSPLAPAGLPGAALQPHRDRSPWFGLLPFRSPLLRESRLISLPAGT